MIKEFEYSYKGFGHIYSKCLIRLVHNENGPFVVICSQAEKIRGVSICNAFETIRAGLEEKLRSESRWEKLDQFKELYEIHKKLPVAIVSFVATMISDYLKGNNSWYKKLKSANSFFWIEHWPRNLNNRPSDEYWNVKWDGENEPNWERMELFEIEEITGYDLKELKIEKC